MGNQESMHIGMDEGRELKPEQIQGVVVHEAVQVKLTKTIKQLQSVNADQLYQKELNPPDFTIEGILPTGLVTFAARPKTGKSWLCLDMADSVASGKQFWGRQTTQGDVLYMALEDSEYRLKERLKQIGSTFPTSLHFVTKGTESLDNGFIEQIKKWETEHDSHLRLLIIDTVARVKGSGKRGKNAYEADTEQYAPLQALAIEKGFSVVCVTHFAKNRLSTDPFESISGSTALFAVSDAGWVITGDRNENNKQLYITGRDVGYEQYEIAFSDCRWELIGSAEEIEQQKLNRAYAENPLVITIKEVLSKADYWIGTASQLSSEVYNRTGQFLGNGNATQASREIRLIIPELMKRESILVTLPNPHGGNKGRLFTFAKKRY